MGVQNYDPAEVSFIYAGQIIEGYEEGTFLEVVRNADSASFKPSSQGGGTRTLSRNKSGRITVTLQQTSPSNAVFAAQHTAMELSGAGIAPALVKDNGGNDIAVAETAWVVKPADLGFANESGSRVWILESDNMDIQPLGNAA